MRDLALPCQPRLLADSLHISRLTSFLIPIPTILLAQMRTHRLLHWGDEADFSINANSDRAIPIDVKIKQVLENPFIPLPSLAQPGMSGIEEMSESQIEQFDKFYYNAMISAVDMARGAQRLGASKQYVNRILMPYSWSLVLVTGDDRAWKSFFDLRVPMDVEPNFRFIARIVHKMYQDSSPKVLQPGDWHMAFSEEAEDVLDLPMPTITGESADVRNRLCISASCGARTSYGIIREETLDKHVDRAAKCFNGGHYSVYEHQAQAAEGSGINLLRGNFGPGWHQLRKLIETKSIAIF